MIMSFKSVWLDMRTKELEEALKLKEQGQTQIWTSYDFAMPIDEYIATKKEAIERVTKE
jgi:hypothetical protein